MKSLDNTPIGCSLATAEFREREAKLLAKFRSAVVEAEELQEGYSFRLPSDGKWMMLVAELIVAERECCPFLTFELAALPNKGPLIVKVIGPHGAKEFVQTVLWKPAASTQCHSGRVVGHSKNSRRQAPLYFPATCATVISAAKQ